MSIVYLESNTETNKSKGESVWEYKETKTTSGNGNIIMLPNETGKYDSVMCSLIISSGTGKIQTTISNRADIIAGIANWIDWDYGAVSSTTTDVFFQVAAVRQVNSSGTTKIEVRII